MKKIILINVLVLFTVLFLLPKNKPVNAGACFGGSYWVYLPMTGDIVCDSSPSHVCGWDPVVGQNRCDYDGTYNCHRAITRCGNLRADPDCDPGACDQSTCEADNFQPCVGTG